MDPIQNSVIWGSITVGDYCTGIEIHLQLQNVFGSNVWSKVDMVAVWIKRPDALQTKYFGQHERYMCMSSFFIAVTDRAENLDLLSQQLKKKLMWRNKGSNSHLFCTKICIKYRKHGSSSFTHAFNCVCLTLFLKCPKSCQMTAHNLKIYISIFISWFYMKSI